MRTSAVFALVIIAALTFCLAITQPAIASDEDEIIDLAENFLKSFETGDYDSMSSLWWHSPKTSSFNPSTSGAFLNVGWDAISKCLKDWVELPVGTWSESMHHPQVMMLGDNVAVISLYVAETVNPPAVEEQTIFLIRGTFVVQKINGKWLIVYEHSSMMPE